MKKQDEAAASEATAEKSLGQVVASIAAALDRNLSPGDVAALRRMRPDAPQPAAFWKVLAAFLEPHGFVSGREAARIEAERRWITILGCMASAAGLHAPRQPVGRRLAEASYAELRMNRLLRASGEGLAREIRTATRFLANKGLSFDCSQLARLVLSDGHSTQSYIRRRLARDYFTNLPAN